METLLDDPRGQHVAALHSIAAQLDISLAQLALAWCLRAPGVASLIVGATRASQLDDNAGASGVTLPESLLGEIDALFPLQVEAVVTPR
jgi:aryl-alcohol dehydrogenase-like predicted oxidoreductase